MSVARYSPDGRFVAAATSHDSYLKLYAVNPETLDLTELATGDFHIHPINDISWSPCSRLIATGGEDCVIVIWRIVYNERTQKTQLEPRRVLRGHVAGISTIQFNHKGTMLASGSLDEKVIVWNVKGGTLFKLLNAHSQPIVAVDFSYDDKILLTASYDGYLRVWSIVDGMALRSLSGAEELMPICAAKFSPNSVYALVTHTDGFTRLLNLANKSTVKKYGQDLLGKKAPMPAPPSPSPPPSPRSVSEAQRQRILTDSNLYSRELAFCRPDLVLVGQSNGIAVYDIKSQKLVDKLTDAPTLCIDVNEYLKAGLSAGPKGIKLFRLNFI